MEDAENYGNIENLKFKYRYAYVDQKKASLFVEKVIDKYQKEGIIKPKDDFYGEKSWDLGNKMCLPSTSSMCINFIFGKRIVGDGDAKINVDDIYELLLPFHKTTPPSLEHDKLEKGWLFASSNNELYHHSIIAFARGLGVAAQSVGGFGSITELKNVFDFRGAIALSLDNSFITDVTFAGNTKIMNKTVNGDEILLENSEGEYVFRKFARGRHVVAVVEMTDKDVTIMDPFRLPQMTNEPLIMTVPIDIVDKYLNRSKESPSRAILFSLKEEDLDKWKNIFSKIYVPKEAIEAVKQKIDTIY